jgi:Carboxypeptidase regulatory-like domain
MRAVHVVRVLIALMALCVAATLSIAARAQNVSANLQGSVTDKSGGALPKAIITAVNTSTQLAHSSVTSDTGQYSFTALPVGEYAVTVELTGFRKDARKITLFVGDNATMDFVLVVGAVSEQVTVEASSEVQEPTRTQISTVIAQQQIQNLPVNGRQFIDFVLLAPGVQVGDTTSGSTDVIIEPVTKISFAGQNIHYNYIAIDGADNMSTASGIQKTTPSQEAVQEFRVINSTYSTEAGRAVGGIVNIITKSGTNAFHGGVYEYFRNNALDATSILAAPGLDALHQNQFGALLGGPIQKDRTFFFANYEGQRRSESPTYNSVILANIAAINNVKTTVFGLPAENLNVNRTTDYDNGLVKMDHSFSPSEYFSLRYFVNDARLANESPLNDGFDLPSGFKDNFFRDQSLVGTLTSTLSPSWVTQLSIQYGRRSFDFPTDSTQPHLEVSNTFTSGVNRGNPDFYRESRAEWVDSATHVMGNHTIQFGGDFNFVRTQESFPLFYPFEADFASLDAFLGIGAFANPMTGAPQPAPFVIFFERFDAASNFTEPTIATSIYQGRRIPTAIRDQAEGLLNHTYEGLFLQDKWRATSRLTLNYGLRWQAETWAPNVLNDPLKNFDPRIGVAYNLGTSRNFVLRGGFGLFHGIIPSPLLQCQIPSCGGVQGPFPGRENIEDALNSTTRLFAFASAPFITNLALTSLLGQPNLLNGAPTTGTYPDAVPASAIGCPSGFLASCGFFGDAVIARFEKNHQEPYGIQASLGVEFEPFKNATLGISGLHVRGVHLGSFYNVNQPDPSGQVLVHDSQGHAGLKNTYFAAPGIPGERDPAFAVYFEAASRWDSVYDGLLVNFDKRFSNHFSAGASYTWSKTIDDGPNPSFVLIPQDSQNFRAERALSADHVPQRFVGNLVLAGPTNMNVVLNNFQLGTIVTIQSPQYFTKFAGFDANGDVFGNNDRVGIEPRDTFKGDSLQTVDLRLSRTFKLGETWNLQAIAEAFNLMNTVNVRFFNTAYGAADFCPFNPTAVGCPAVPTNNLEGSPNPSYGTPRAVNNPRQIQLALRFSF